MILQALGWSLLHSLWQAAFVALLVRVLLFVVRSAQVRFALAWSGLVVIAIGFVITLRLELDRAWMLDEGPVAPPDDLLVAIDLALPWLVALWVCGVAVFGLRAAFGFIGVARLRARARAVEPELAALCQALAAKLELARTVAIAECEALDVPAVIGWLRPLILLPVGLATRLDRVALEAAIAHELAHVRRHDYLLNAIATVIEVLFFHHPCVWWLAGVARREREHACDDLVVAHVQSRLSYARSLLLLEQLRGAAAPAGTLAVDGASLLDRVHRLHAQPPRRVLALRSLVPLLALGAALGLAAVVPACIDADEEAAESDEFEFEVMNPIEGMIQIGDPDAVLDIAWLPESVERHAAQIEAAARRTGVDPDLLAIIVFVESNGDPNAESPSGARGLMQLTPRTITLVATNSRMARGMKGILKVHRSNIFVDPDLNLHYGATYLSWQLDRYGSIELAAAAYNGGPKAVENWLAGEAPLSEETDRYRTRVMQLWQARHAASLQ